MDVKNLIFKTKIDNQNSINVIFSQGVAILKSRGLNRGPVQFYTINSATAKQWIYIFVLEYS